MIGALIVDDEGLARDKLRRLLGHHSDVRLVGEAKSGGEAVDLIRRKRPDLVFLDIDMPDRTGFEVLEAIQDEWAPMVVFVTAYDEYAVRAFEVHAVDYLLKPFEERRLVAALERARARREGSAPAAIEPLLAVLREMRERQRELERRLAAFDRERLMIREGAEMRFVEVDEIDWVEAADNYVELHVGPHRFLVRETLSGVEDRLDPHRFTRIHRSTIVNDARISVLRPQSNGELEAVLRDGTTLPVGRSYRDRVTSKWRRI